MGPSCSFALVCSFCPGLRRARPRQWRAILPGVSSSSPTLHLQVAVVRDPHGALLVDFEPAPGWRRTTDAVFQRRARSVPGVGERGAILARWPAGAWTDVRVCPAGLGVGPSPMSPSKDVLDRFIPALGGGVLVSNLTGVESVSFIPALSGGLGSMARYPRLRARLNPAGARGVEWPGVPRHPGFRLIPALAGRGPCTHESLS